MSPEEIRTSKILAKAVLPIREGKVKIIVVFQNSSYFHFFHLFEAKSARTPRRSWSPRGTQMIYRGNGYHTFESYVKETAQHAHIAGDYTLRINGKKTLKALYKSVCEIKKLAPQPGQTFFTVKKAAGRELNREEHMQVRSQYARITQSIQKRN